MVSTAAGLPNKMPWVVDFLNTADLRTHGAARMVLVRDRLQEPSGAALWLRQQGFAGSSEDLTDELVALRAIREEIRASLRGTQPFRTMWSAHVEISGSKRPLIRPASDSVRAWVEAHLLEGFLAPHVSRLRICGADDCQWAFYDRSKNGRARWCSTATCGNRMKTRAYRRRRRQQATPQSVAAPRRIAQRTSRFRREGDYWTIGPPRRTFRLKDSKGLGYLARLLAEPHREFHVLDLVGSGGPAVVAPPVEVPILDPEAVRRYRTRIRDLEEEVAEAEAWNDDVRASVARDELAILAGEVARVSGLHGRPRSFTSESERARVSVTRVIKAALSRIGEQSPEFKHHFASTVRTGTYCSYNPDPRLPMRWEL